MEHEMNTEFLKSWSRSVLVCILMVITSTEMSIKDIVVALAVSVIAPVIRWLDDADPVFGSGRDE
jgi:hypothetical protein